MSNNTQTFKHFESTENMLSKNSQIHWISNFVFPMKRTDHFSNITTSQSKAHFSSRPADNKWRDFLYFIVQIFIFEKLFPDGCNILTADRPK